MNKTQLFVQISQVYVHRKSSRKLEMHLLCWKGYENIYMERAMFSLSESFILDIMFNISSLLK